MENNNLITKGRELVIDTDKLIHTINVEHSNDNCTKYYIATRSTTTTFINQRIDSCFEINDIVQLNTRKLIAIPKTQQIINITYINGLLICFLLYFAKIIPVTLYLLITSGLLAIKCISYFIFLRIQNSAEDKINNQIEQEIYSEPHLNMYNIHIPLPYAEQESYVKILRLLEEYNIDFPDIEGLDIRDKIDFLKKVIKYTDDGFFIVCTKGENTNDVTGNL